jgi:DNA-binding NtrC family response regulator
MAGLAAQVDSLSLESAPILISGERGTETRLLARIIHDRSLRAGQRFVAVDCRESTPILEIELFGHERSAFADAGRAEQGLFEAAEGGTLFLDEIGALATELQTKLHAALATQGFRRLGGSRVIPLDVRLIAASHGDLAAEVRQGCFREDLFSVLAMLPLRLPPLRTRGPAEITRIAATFLDEAGRGQGRGPVRMSDDFADALTRYDWPGNIRELRNVMERAVLLAGEKSTLLARHLPQELVSRDGAAKSQSRGAATAPSDLSLGAVAREHVMRVMELYAGNRSQAAAALGITRSTLYKKLAEYQLTHIGRG